MEGSKKFLNKEPRKPGYEIREWREEDGRLGRHRESI
jgi:hypothetical protein